MGRLLDITGNRFGRLVAQWPVGYTKRRNVVWLNLCDCGNLKVIDAKNLQANRVKSCGCIYGAHGLWGTPEYRIWGSLRQRCLNPNDKGYADYGGRGITVCERWDRFENFIMDVGRRPSPEYSLDRIDNDGNYEPGNVRWATADQQAANKGRKGVPHAAIEGTQGLLQNNASA